MQNDVFQHLADHPLFQDIGDPGHDIVSTLKKRDYPQGKVIYRPGVEACHAYLVISGAVKFEMSASSGQQVFVEIVDKGFLIGELELLSGIEYHSTAVANEETELVLIPKETLFRLIAEKPEFAIRFTRQLATNFYFYQILATEREASNLKTRLANLLMSLSLRFGERNGDSIRLATSNDQLSDMLNASRQRINMQLNEWQKEGVLQCRYGQVLIHDINQFGEQSGLSGGALTEENTTPYNHDY